MLIPGAVIAMLKNRPKSRLRAIEAERDELFGLCVGLLRKSPKAMDGWESDISDYYQKYRPVYLENCGQNFEEQELQIKLMRDLLDTARALKKALLELSADHSVRHFE